MRLRTPHFGPFAGRLCREDEAGGLVPLDEPAGDPPPPPVLLPPESAPAPSGLGLEIAGEISGPDTRGNRDAMVESVVRHHGEQYRAWARAHADTAVSNWDRGVRTGRIARPRG